MEMSVEAVQPELGLMEDLKMPKNCKENRYYYRHREEILERKRLARLAKKGIDITKGNEEIKQTAEEKRRKKKEYLEEIAEEKRRKKKEKEEIEKRREIKRQLRKKVVEEFLNPVPVQSGEKN